MRIVSILAVALLFFAASAFAVELTPETFIQIDIEAREATLSGMQERLALLGTENVAVQDEVQLNTATEELVAGVFARYGITQNDHGVYAEKNAKAIGEFLESRPDYQEAYESLDVRFADISNSINTLLER